MIEIDNSENFLFNIVFRSHGCVCKSSIQPLQLVGMYQKCKMNDFFRGARRSPDENRERTKLRLFIVNQLFQSARPKRCLKS